MNDSETARGGARDEADASGPTADLEGPPLVLQGVVKSFGEVRALDGVSLTVEGGVFGLLGANGAGKSTLFRSILELVPFDEGTIRVCGLDIKTDGLAARRHVGYLPEELRLYDRLTGRELLSFVAGLRRLDNREERLEWLELFGLTDAADLLIAEYSLGMRKKIALTAALMGSPRLALLDEPLNGLDTESMRKLRLKIAQMAGQGTTFVVSSHVMSFVERVCDRVAILRRGRLAAQGSLEEVRRQAGLPESPFEDVFLKLAVD